MKRARLALKVKSVQPALKANLELKALKEKQGPPALLDRLESRSVTTRIGQARVSLSRIVQMPPPISETEIWFTFEFL